MPRYTINNTKFKRPKSPDTTIIAHPKRNPKPNFRSRHSPPQTDPPPSPEITADNHHASIGHPWQRTRNQSKPKLSRKLHLVVRRVLGHLITCSLVGRGNKLICLPYSLKQSLIDQVRSTLLDPNHHVTSQTLLPNLNHANSLTNCAQTFFN